MTQQSVLKEAEAESGGSFPATADYAPLFYWVRERESMRVRRERGDPPPWTEDPVLANWRFCNVRREDDAVTRWIAAYIRRPFAHHPDLWFMLCAARLINEPDTLQDLIASGAWPDRDGFEPAAMAAKLEERAGHGKKNYNAAYVIPPSSEKGSSKNRHVAETVLGNLWENRGGIGTYFGGNGERRLQDAHAMLTAYPGWGDFLAYQAVVDMRFTRLLENATDVASWAAAGPGTRQGLNRLHGRPVGRALPQARALEEMRAIYACVEAETGVPMDFSDVPNILCETDKFLRATADGKPLSQRYSPPAQADLFAVPEQGG